MAENEDTQDSGPTRRMVLKQERVLIVPEGVEPDLEAVRAALGLNKSAKPLISEAWRVLGEATGDKAAAIKHFAGEPGASDSKPGDYRAPTHRSWKDGKRYKPPVQVVDTEPLD